MRSGYRITRDRFFAPNEVRTLLNTCKDRAELDQSCRRKTWVTRYMLIHLALNSGLRVSEIAALKIQDLFLKSNDQCLIVRHGKGNKKRDVYLDRDIIQHLQEYIEIKKALGEPTDDNAPLLAGRGGQHFTTTALEISFKQATKAAGLAKSYSIHCSRHTYATLLLAKTSNIRFVQQQLGHSNINMTALYTHLLPEMNHDLANAILDFK